MTLDPTWPIGKATDTPSDDPEVEGHAVKGKFAVEQPSDDPEAEVAGHARFKAVEQPSDDPEAEVAGHGRRPGSTEQPTDDEQDPEAEVEGHINSLLNPDLATNRTKERLDDADQARRANESSPTRDGGMLDKIRRRLEG